MVDNTDFQNTIVHADALPSFTLSDFTPLQSSYLYVSLISRLITLLLLAGTAVTAIITIDEIPVLVKTYIPIVLAFIGLLSLIFVLVGIKYKGYLVRTQDITYRTGWLTRTVTTVPFNRIQHVEVNQGLVDRWLQLASLRIFTAGGSQSDLNIPGIKLAQANNLKHFLLQKISSDEEE